MEFLSYLGTLWQVTTLALRLDPAAVQIVEADPHGGLIALGVAFVGGVSLLLGQSVVLFLNRIRPGRFVASLLLNGVVFTTGWIATCIVLWLVARYVFDAPASLGPASRIVMLSTAPFVFGFLVLIPYAGPFLSRVLYVWSLLITVATVQVAFHLDFTAALVCVALGWLVMMLLTSTVGRPVVAVRNRVWHRVVGTSRDASVTDILTALAEAPPERADRGRPT